VSSKTNIFAFCIGFIILFFIACGSNQKPTKIEEELPVALKQERTSLSFDSMFVEFPIENKLQYFELLSYKDSPLLLDPSIQDDEEGVIYKMNYDRSCMLEYDSKTKTNRLYSSIKERGESILKLGANNPEFDKLTIPISIDEGILHFDRVKGVEIFNKNGDGFVKTWEHAHKEAQSKPSTNIVYNIAERRIEYYDKNVESGKMEIKYFDFYSDVPKVAEVELKAERIMYLPSANIYLSKSSDYVSLHPSDLMSVRSEALQNYKLPHYPREIAIYNSKQNFQKDLNSKFGYQISRLKAGFHADKTKDNVIRGIYTHQDGINIFSIIEDQIHVEALHLAENESKTNRLFASKDFVGSTIYETNTPGQYSKETKISNIRLLIYSFATGDLFEVAFPKELQLEYDVVMIEGEVFLFNKEKYYRCRLFNGFF